MDVALLIKQRLEDLGLEQRDLARAAEVTESYVSQLLTRRRMPPAPNRTDIYDRMDRVLKLPRGELASLAAHQHKEHLKRKLGEETAPLFGEVREMVLHKCRPARVRGVRAIFERQPFGELERMVTNCIVGLIKRIAAKELDNEPWLRTVAKLAGSSFRDTRALAQEFIDTDIVQVSPARCVTFLDPLVESWDIDLATFELEIVLEPKVSAVATRVFRFAEHADSHGRRPEPGFVAFLENRALSGTMTNKERDFLAGLRFSNRHPTEQYYYRELQSLRDPMHFRAAGGRTRS